MSLLKLFEKARSTSEEISENATESDPELQSESEEVSPDMDEVTGSGFLTANRRMEESVFHVFCLPSDPGILVRRPLTSFAKALVSFRRHMTTEHHKFAVVRADDFRKVMENQQPAIQHQINQAMANTVASNRQKLALIIKVILLCGRQNIALRGHRDNITDLENDTLSTENHSNFWAILQFRVDSGDTVIGEHLATAARNATYTSSVIQNQLVYVLCHQIRQKILDKVKRATWYTVIADEVTDISNKEQLS